MRLQLVPLDIPVLSLVSVVLVASLVSAPDTRLARTCLYLGLTLWPLALPSSSRVAASS